MKTSTIYILLGIAGLAIVAYFIMNRNGRNAGIGQDDSSSNRGMVNNNDPNPPSMYNCIYNGTQWGCLYTYEITTINPDGSTGTITATGCKACSQAISTPNPILITNMPSPKGGGAGAVGKR